jgi:glyoxylase-like metal-dependent hydrolase (beta-lactamase superfamily II)
MPVTELDLQALGIWWIPLPHPAARRGATVNAWAIEDDALGITLFGCGPGTPEAVAALTRGLAQAGATLHDVGRVIVPGVLPDHAGALPWIAEHAGRPVEVLASWPVRDALALPASSARELRAGARLDFKRFASTAVRCGGLLPPLTCLFAEHPGLLFSSDHLLDDPGAYARLAGGSRPDVDRDAYRLSLARLAALPVSVVLPGRGPPFAGHRRVVREALAQLSPPASSRRPRGPRPLSPRAPPGPTEGREFGSRHVGRLPPSPPQLQLHHRPGESG